MKNNVGIKRDAIATVHVACRRRCVRGNDWIFANRAWFAPRAAGKRDSRGRAAAAAAAADASRRSFYSEVRRLRRFAVCLTRIPSSLSPSLSPFILAHSHFRSPDATKRLLEFDFFRQRSLLSSSSENTGRLYLLIFFSILYSSNSLKISFQQKNFYLHYHQQRDTFIASEIKKSDNFLFSP